MQDSSSSPSDFAHLLANTKAVDILQDQFQLVTIDSNADVQQAHKILSDHNIYSAPVIDRESNTILGLIDWSDLVTFLVSIFVKKATQDPVQSAAAAIAHASYHKDDLPRMQYRFNHHPAKEIINFSGDNPYKPMSADSSLQEVINAMAHGLSRVPLLDAQGHIVKMISQSNVISFIAKHIDGIGAKGSQTLRETGIGTRTLVMARLEERAIDAFAKIVDRKISHVALIDRAGHLAGNLSVKDLKAAMDFSRLLYTVNDYVNIIRRENLKSVHPSIHANDTDTVAKTIVRLATIRIHRMYLTSIPPDQLEQTSTYAPTGVISLRDVLTLFAAK